ncbi:hypothetical protein BCV70DRAFT_202310 [Testicularia cyperi]|uniref:Exonuclease V n=1 Tax=Testicularia cyperi TaxID=1882483 RepID=A0A317XK05_9BASI|nr:hypothetical protein BCV70DRAFT_202310 [Testicularia cyperi]
MASDSVTGDVAEPTKAQSSHSAEITADEPIASRDLERTGTVTQLATSPEGTEHRTKKERRLPKSLPDHFRHKGYLSVSDLVGPSWCEYNYQYGILSLSHLPPSQRPQSITTEAGQVLAPASDLIQKKEKVLDGGKAIHTILEREVAPVQVAVQTETREDAWALRLLNIWCDVKALLQIDPGNKGTGKGKQKACVREVPVYGWIQGVFVMGIIDEIEKRAIKINAHPKQRKTWSNQEEWKKEQLRKSKSSPKKAKIGASTGQTNGQTLLGFFASSSQSSANGKSKREADNQADTTKEEKEGWGYFLSDTKTRISSWLPAEGDQFGARMQCMTYRRLFDGLCLGALRSERQRREAGSDSSQSSSQGSPPSNVTFDPNATPMDWTETFASQRLDPYQTLSDVFLADAIPLCESWGTDLLAFAESNANDVDDWLDSRCTLQHITLLLEEALRQLVQDARKGQDQPPDAAAIGTLQAELALNYRQQRKPRKSKRKREKSNPAKGVRDPEEKVSTSQQTTLDAVIAPVQPDSESQEPQMEIPVRPEQSLDPDTKSSMEVMEGHNEVDIALSQTFSTPSSSPKKPPSQSRADVSGSSPSSPRKAAVADDIKDDGDETSFKDASSRIIGVVKFRHSSLDLDAYLSHMLSMWKGERALKGVRVSQTRRCWNCEWRDGCEWRTLQSDSALLAHEARRKKISETASAVVTAATGSDEEDFWNDLDYSQIEVKDDAGNVLDW